MMATGAPTSSTSASSAVGAPASSKSNTIGNYGHQPDGVVGSDVNLRTYQFAADKSAEGEQSCVLGGPKMPVRRLLFTGLAADGQLQQQQQQQQQQQPVQPLNDGAALSSTADLNCRHLIRSPTVVAADGDGRRQLGGHSKRAPHHEPTNQRELEVEYGEPLTSLTITRRKKQEETSGGASDRPSLFKRAASGLWPPTRTKRLPVSFLTDRPTSSGQVRTTLVQLASGSIKSDELQQQHTLQRRLGQTIKSLAASGGGNWSRFKRPQATNKPINVRGEDQIQAKQDEEDIKLERQDADSLGSDSAAVVVSSSSLSSLLSSNQQQQQRKAIRHLLRNSVSCELPSLQQRQKSSTKLISESNNKLSEQATLEHQSTRARRAKRRTRRRLSSVVQKVELQSSSSNNNNNMSQNKYIIAQDKAFKRVQSQGVEEVSQFDQERRSTVCSSVGGCDSCDLSSSNNNNNQNLCAEPDCNSSNRDGCAHSRQANRRGNSNDCNNPSQCQSAVAAAALVNIIIRDTNKRQPPGSACSGGGGAAGSGGTGPAASRKLKDHSAVAGSGLKERENWSMNIEFLLAVIGFAVDLGNIWRFPYICYRNGGGAFLIPYTIMFILGGLPIFYLEMSLGQYFSSGCLTVWRRVCPMAKGIGYAMCVLNFFTGLFYNTIISWAVFFFVESFTTNLPWTNCNNPWNTADCKTIDQRQALKSTLAYNFTSSNFNGTPSASSLANYSSPTKDYFEREVLQLHLSSGIDDLGSIRRPLAIYLAIVFVCIYFAIWKGVKSTGKAVWITALLPYFVLIPLLIRGVFLEGAWLGIRYYLEPQWVKIFDVDVWVEAAKQIYFSLGPGFGTLMALSSYNKFHHNTRRDAFIAASVNYFASFIAGLVVFALLGYMATIMDVDINEVATEGPGLVFQVYPEGLATMRFSAMWSVLFFTMVISLGIDSTFGGLESVITGLCDEYPRVLRAHRGTFIGFLIVLIYFCSLPTTTYGGNYVIYVLEAYGTSLSLIFIVLVETIVVCWIYGTDRFCNNLEEMYGERPGPFWRICWKYISPTILLLIFLAACGQEFDKYHTLKMDNGNYTFPSWAPIVGLLMTGSSVCCIPIYAIYYIKTKTSGTLWERLKIASRPEGDPKVAEKDTSGDAMIDKISDENDIHLNAVI